MQLTVDNRCAIFGRPERPDVCNRLRPMPEMCGETFDEAMRYLDDLERATSPEIREPRAFSAADAGRA